MDTVVIDLSAFGVVTWTATLHLYDEHNGKLVCGRELPDKAEILGFEALRGNMDRVCRSCLRMALCGEMDRLAVI